VFTWPEGIGQSNASVVDPASTSYAGWIATALTNMKMIQAKIENL
jgi:hypothetical protein